MPDSGFGALYVKQQNRQPQQYKNKSGKEDRDRPSSKRIKCNYCRKFEHEAVDYYAKKNTQQKASHAASETALLTNKRDEPGCCLDSGCTSHLYDSKELFVDTKDVSSGLKLANNTTTKVETIGDVRITAVVDKKEKNIRLTDTLYVSVPELRTNLLSVAKVVDNKHQVLFIQNRAIVQDLQVTAMIVNRINNLFYLQEEPPQAYIASKHEPSRLNMWHERLGHLNTKDVAATASPE